MTDMSGQSFFEGFQRLEKVMASGCSRLFKAFFVGQPHAGPCSSECYLLHSLFEAADLRGDGFNEVDSLGVRECCFRV